MKIDFKKIGFPCVGQKCLAVLISILYLAATAGDGYSQNDLDIDGDGYSVNQGDCDDTRNSIYPGAWEICEDGIDQDCSGADISCDIDGDGSIDYVDNDGDGYSEYDGDCDDTRNSVYPGATEICFDGADQDCIGDDDCCGLCGTPNPAPGDIQGIIRDADTGDAISGALVQTDNNLMFSLPNGFYLFIHDSGNYNITVSALGYSSIGATAVPVYENTTTIMDFELFPLSYIDSDGDGYNAYDGDCDDANSAINTGATEICNGIDDNCTGGIDEGLSTDEDGDGHYTPDSCLAPNDDCDDNDENEHPDQTWYKDDWDGDGYSDGSTNTVSCTRPAGYKVASEVDVPSGDCDDDDDSIYPGATEICNDGIDNDCDGGTDQDDSDCAIVCTDADNDGYFAKGGCGTAVDCNDGDGDINPGATEVCGDSIDQDCNGSDLICDYVDSEPVSTISSPAISVSILAGGSVTFAGSVTGGNSPFVYVWDFNGGATNVAVKDPGNVTFSIAGTYTVTFTVTDVDNDTDSDTVTITVNAPAVDPSDDDGGGGGGGCFLESIF